MDSPNDFTGNPLLHVSPSALETTLILGEVIAYGLRVSSLTHRIFTAEDLHGRQMAYMSSRSTSSSAVGSQICRNKAATKTLLRLRDVPTAAGMKMPERGREPVERFIEQRGWPVVVKPLAGVGGKGVTANIQGYDELWEAIGHAKGPSGFLIEKHVPGEDYRFLVLDNEVIGVWVRDAANVIGDGAQSVSDLIDEKNKLRRTNPHLRGRLIKKDSLVEDHLKRSGMGLNDVPAAQQKVYLRSAANLSSGGDNVEVTDDVDPSLAQIAVRAAQAIPGADMLGLDLLLQDHRRPASEQDVNICEINENPGISAHDFPLYGPPRPTARAYVEHEMRREALTPGSYADQRQYELTIEGEIQPGLYRKHAREVEEALPVSVSFGEETLNQIRLTVSGTSLGIAAFISRSVRAPATIGPVESVVAVAQQP